MLAINEKKIQSTDPVVIIGRVKVGLKLGDDSNIFSHYDSDIAELSKICTAASALITTCY